MSPRENELLAAARLFLFGHGPGRAPMTPAEIRGCRMRLKAAVRAYDNTPEDDRRAHLARVLGQPEANP